MQRRPMTMRDVRDIAFVILIALCFLTLIASKTHAQYAWYLPSSSQTAHVTFNGDNLSQLPFGNVSHANAHPLSKDNFLFVTQFYAMSYNETKGGPNWVSWTLNKGDIGTEPRGNDFHAETSLPPGFRRALPKDYDHTGYDRGHMCDSKDRTRTVKANHATFSMANMLPQTPQLNRVMWKAFETYSRKLATAGTTVYIVAGCYGTQGHLKGAWENVPDRCWKIVAHGKDVDAVDMPNTAIKVNTDWHNYKTTVPEIEKSTGFHFAIPRS